MGMAFERRHLTEEETKQLEGHYHEFIEKMKIHKEEMKNMQYGEGEA